VPCLSFQQAFGETDAKVNEQNIAYQIADSDRLTFKAHLDFRFVKTNLELLRENVKNRNSPADPDVVVELYDKWVKVLEELERVRADRNANAKAMKVRPHCEPKYALVLHNGSTSRLDISSSSLLFSCLLQEKLDPERRTELVEQGKALKERITVLEAEIEVAEGALQREGQKLPNLSHPEVCCHACSAAFFCKPPSIF